MEIAMLFLMVIGFMLIGVPIAVSLGLSSILLLIGAWDYWYPFATERAWLETDDLPMPDWLRFIEPWLNEGEAYEKLPRFIPYAALPLGVALLTFRFLQQTWRILNGRSDRLIAGHEAEEMMEELEMMCAPKSVTTGKGG